MDEGEIKILGNSKQAVLAMGLFKPFLDKEKENVLAKLKAAFRSNSTDLSTYIGFVSTLVSLDDLEIKMLKTIKAGQNLAEKVMSNNGK